MAESFSASAFGVSPGFVITYEDLRLEQLTGITPISIDGVPPPTLGFQGGASHAHDLVNLWFPWIDEPIIDPQFDGVCEFLAMASNRPTFIKDYFFISLMRAADYLLAPVYIGLFQAQVDGVTPIAADPNAG